MKTKTLIALFILFLVIYLYPVQKFTFEQNYPTQDTVLASLQAFRQEPTKTLKSGGHGWTYHTTSVGDMTILFLHGMGGSYDIWWHQINYFKTRYKTMSVSYPPVKNLEDLSTGILAILDQEKTAKVILIGSSLGGYLAQYLATTYPERVIKVSLGNTFPPNPLQKAKNKTLTKLMTYLPEWLVIKTIRKKYNDEVIPASKNSPIVKAFLNELLGKIVNRKVFLARYYCVIDSFKANIPPNIPIQIIESDNDPLVEKELRDLLKTTYPQARIVTLHQEGHFPYLYDADHYNNIIETFIKK